MSSHRCVHKLMQDFYRYVRKDDAHRSLLDEAIPAREDLQVPSGKDAKEFALEDQIKRLGVRLPSRKLIMHHTGKSPLWPPGLHQQLTRPRPCSQAKLVQQNYIRRVDRVVKVRSKGEDGPSVPSQRLCPAPQEASPPGPHTAKRH